MQEVRRRLRKFPDLRARVRNVPSFNLGGGNFDIDFAMRGPDLETLADYAERLRDEGARELAASWTPTRRCKLDKPELRVQIDRDRAADLGVDTDGHRHGPAPDGRRRRPRSPASAIAAINDDYDVQLRLAERRPQRSRADLAASTCRAAAASWCGSTTS